MVDYSQSGEQSIILEFFRDLPTGHFLDVGAYDGVTYSNTKALEDLGWEGVCVEPNPDSAALCAQARRRSRVMPVACVADPNVRDVIFRIPPLPVLSTLSTANDEDVRRICENCGVPFTGYVERRIPAMTIDQILDYARLPRLDFLSIDTEWHNPQTLAGCDLARWSPRLVCIEANGTDEQLPIAAQMERQGYRMLVRHVNNDFYVRV